MNLSLRFLFSRKRSTGTLQRFDQYGRLITDLLLITDHNAREVSKTFSDILRQPITGLEFSSLVNLESARTLKLGQAVILPWGDSVFDASHCTRLVTF